MSAVPRIHDPAARGFASDNYSGVHPEVLDAIAAVNGGHVRSYGSDPYTQEALQEVFRAHFGEQATAYPVFNGTGANVVALSLMVPRWGAVVCSDWAHIHVDECGAPEKVAGIKLIPAIAPDGRLTAAQVRARIERLGDEHFAQPLVVSLTQVTELGTVYAVDDLREIVETAHAAGASVHLDGARIANAAAALGVPMRAFTTDIGVDVVSFGGTKNGMLLGEAVVVLNPDAVSEPLYVRKLSMQLASKMRFISAQLVAMLSGDLWLRSAAHANAMARRLADAVREVPGVELTREPEASQVFAILPPRVTADLQASYPFYVWDEGTGEVRWVCSFDTTEDDVDGFAAALRERMAAG